MIERVRLGGGKVSVFAGDTALIYEDDGVSYVFTEEGEFWTILKNP